MHVAVTGSVATDHLMTFAGRFAESLLAEQLDKVSVSFLAEDLQIRRGGVAANICFGMGNLGQRPLLVAAVGEDFVDYRAWLERHGVDCESVLVSSDAHTARFTCTTDRDMAQIATFYPGAMTEARAIELRPVADRVGGLDLVLVGPNDPVAMARHTEECRERGIPFAADPSQQLTSLEGPQIKELVEGAAYLFTNEYESHLVKEKTGWSDADILALVTTSVTTKGKDGALVHTRGQEPIRVPIVPEARRADPTGVGDAFRAGFLTGVAGGLPHRQCAEIGSLLAAYTIETIGTQEYVLGTSAFLDRLARAYGAGSAELVAGSLDCLRP